MTTSEKLKLLEAREQIQEDIIAYMDNPALPLSREDIKDDLCQIVVNNFKHHAKENEIITEGDKRLKTYTEREEFFEDTAWEIVKTFFSGK